MAIVDSISKLPIFTNHLNRLTEFLKAERRLGLISIKLTMINNIEETKGWEIYDLIVSEYTKIIKQLLDIHPLKVKEPRELLIKYERGDEFLLFIPLNNEIFKGSSEVFDDYIDILEDLIRARHQQIVHYLGEEELDLIIGKSIIDYKGIVRTERLIYDALENARINTAEQLEKDIKLHKEELQYIIKERKIQIVYQPIVSLLDKKIFGFEALSRFMTRNVVLSTEGIFILAMKLNMTQYLEKICREMAIMSSKGMKDDHILFINLDPNELISGNLNVNSFSKLVLDYGLCPSRIVFEITERRYIEDLEEFNKKYDDFRHAGYKIAVDDVGAGYSSLNTIAVLKPDIIKIDINLIRDIHKDFVKKEIVKTLMLFAQKINTKVLSEGIETQDEYHTLFELGSELGQGYFFGRPDKNLDVHYKSLPH